MNNTDYSYIIVESFIPSDTSGRHGLVHIHPLPGQDPYLPSMFVECSKEMSDTNSYPIGTKFRIKAKITNKEGGVPFIYSHYSWGYIVVK